MLLSTTEYTESHGVLKVFHADGKKKTQWNSLDSVVKLNRIL